MRIVVGFLCALVVLIGADIQSKITQSQKRLTLTTKKIQGVNLRLSKLARQIRQYQSELKAIDTKLQNLNILLKKASKEYQEKLRAYEKTKNSIETLSQKENTLRQQLILLIAKVFSKSLLLTSINAPTEEDIFKEEILKALQKYEHSRLQRVSKEYTDTVTTLQQKKKRLIALEKEIDTLLKNKATLKRLKIVKSQKMQKLLKDKQKYNKELQKLIEQRQALSKTLAKLNILKEQKIAKKSKKVHVKSYGEKSYGRLKTLRYRGAKTIAPLEHFVVMKKYGVYKDPIYNIEIPNENVELRPIKANAKVRNIFNGRVILAKWTPHLKNVVIVQATNGLYLIYANLDKIAPYIKKGRRIKKGYTIGRVNNKLIFEITKNNAHINPLDVIRLPH